MSDFNQQIIAEFRANRGKVGGHFANSTIILLHTLGAKSGNERVNPVVTFEDDGRQVIIASKAGAPENPAWYYNILAHPEITVELGTETFKVHATVAEEPERSKLYEKMVKRSPGFAEYERKTSRVIPVLTLTRI